MDNTDASSNATFEETKSSNLGLSAAERKARREELKAKREHAKAHVVIVDGSPTIVTAARSHVVIHAPTLVSADAAHQPHDSQSSHGDHKEITISPAISEGRLRRDSNGTAGSVKSMDKSMDALETLSDRHTTRSMASTRKSGASSRPDPKKAERDEQRRKMVLEAKALLKQKVETVSQPEFVPTVTVREQDLLGARPTLNLVEHRSGSHLSASSSEAPTRHQSVIESNSKNNYLDGGNAINTGYSSPAGSPAARDPADEEVEAQRPATPKKEATERTPLLINGTPDKKNATNNSSTTATSNANREPEGRQRGPILIRVEAKPEKERNRFCCWGCCSCGCCGKNPDCCCYTPCSDCCRKDKAPCVIQ